MFSVAFWDSFRVFEMYLTMVKNQMSLCLEECFMVIWSSFSVVNIYRGVSISNAEAFMISLHRL